MNECQLQIVVTMEVRQAQSVFFPLSLSFRFLLPITATIGGDFADTTNAALITYIYACTIYIYFSTCHILFGSSRDQLSFFLLQTHKKGLLFSWKSANQYSIKQIVTVGRPDGASQNNNYFCFWLKVKMEDLHDPGTLVGS